MDVARCLNGEIVSADSRQVYKYLDIGTAKPSEAQLRSVRHHFISEVDPSEKFTAGRFGLEGRERIKEIIRAGKVPIVAGGSGLYIRSLVDGLFEGPGADPEIRRILEDKVADGCVIELMEELQRV